MILFSRPARLGNGGRFLALAAATLVIAACAPVDDTIGSRLAQPPAGTPPQTPIDVDDIAIVGQEVGHAILQLPAIAEAPVPPLVRFTGVTSIVTKVPVDTEPYTQLLRDRLLLLTREKLRFVEHTLPPYVPPSKHKKKAEAPPMPSDSDADYEILAELRGQGDSDTLKIQVEFVDIHTSEVLFNGLYRIHKEAQDEAPAPPPDQVPEAQPPSAPPPSEPSPSTSQPMPAPAPGDAPVPTL
jgi:hypothetical protein